MAQNSLATQLQPESAPEQRTVPLHKQATQTVSVSKRLSLSKFEKCLLSVGGMIVLGLMLAVVSASNSVSTAQQRLQDVNTKITSFENRNTSDRQTISELLNRSRLEKNCKTKWHDAFEQ
ncbi:hypothetical protein [Secundilactobacillus odoratitofui]|uniref:hypothetical protein n=1 Tax=Secundilactobacillus odoratitofui TaxID=480930 RepID=UPI0006D183A9|nr:hypothetical protein [Secundilactobacillus odoratitofui]